MTRIFIPFSLRLDRATVTRIRRLAAQRGASNSAVVREAIAQYQPEPSAAATDRTALDRLRRYVGVVSTGGAQHASNAHAHVREILALKRRARRPR